MLRLILPKHCICEKNGNLRLITPQQYDEAVVVDQPNFPGLAAILTQNREVIHQMNPMPECMVAKPDRLAIDAIDLIRDMSLRNAVANNGENREKKSIFSVSKFKSIFIITVLETICAKLI